MDHKTFNNNFSDVELTSSNGQLQSLHEEIDMASETSYMSLNDDIEFSLKNKYEHTSKVNEHLILRSLKYFRSKQCKWETLKDWDNYRVRVWQSGSLLSNQHPVFWIQIRIKLVRNIGLIL